MRKLPRYPAIGCVTVKLLGLNAPRRIRIRHAEETFGLFLHRANRPSLHETAFQATKLKRKRGHMLAPC